MSKAETKPILRRTISKAVSDTLIAPKPTELADPSEFIKLELEVPEDKVQTLEEYLIERHKLEKENYRPTLTTLIATMDQYVKEMRRGNNSTPEIHGKWVTKLLVTYTQVLRDPDVLVLFDTLLWYYGTYYNDAFFSEMPYRGLNMAVIGTAEQLRFFTHITAVCQQLGATATRTDRIRTLDFVGAITAIPRPAFEKQANGLATYINYYRNF